MENGAQYTARMFADCTYEGDLMAQAGVTYTWGRESSAQYGESLAGVRGETPIHQFLVDLSPNDADGKLLPEISAAPAGEPGAADRKVQAYNFRMILSHDPANQVAVPEARALRPGALRTLRPPARRHAEKAGPPVAHWAKCSPSSPSPITRPTSTTTAPSPPTTSARAGTIPTRTYARREEIWRDHEEYTKQLFWFLAHDPRVPPSLQKEVNEWGLAKDEFLDTGHWPNQLYIREARRMVGEYVMSQKDIQTDLTKPDPIGMGSYNSDSHNVQRIVNTDGFVRNEGDMQVAVQPYQIPYRVLLPKKRRGAEPAGAGLLLRHPRGLQHAAHGAAVHDSGPGRGGRGRDGDPPLAGRAGYRYRGAHAHAGGARRHPRVRAHHAGGAGGALPRQMAPAGAKAVE